MLKMKCVLRWPSGLEQQSGKTNFCNEECLQTAGRCALSQLNVQLGSKYKTWQTNPQSHSGAVRCFTCAQSTLRDPDPQAPVWEVVSIGRSSRVTHFTLWPVESVSGHLSCGSWFQSWLLADEQQLAIYSFTLVCQYSFFFLSPSLQSNVFLPRSLTWFMALSKKWNRSGAPVLWEQNCLFLAHSLRF